MPTQTLKTSQTGARHRAREFCLALIFAVDVGRRTPDKVFEQAGVILQALIELWALDSREARKLTGEIADYGRRLAELYFAYSEEIDQIVGQYAEGWALQRMPAVDRSILRLALGEMLYVSEVPVGVSIDEAVELAKEYSTGESGKFINGILGAVARQ